uniref:Methyltransferase type 11 domain-containing protein n=1 Tax=Bionectria ochroleuca TaxID=29856 RepID=A0A0B7KQL8_BIOOC
MRLICRTTRDGRSQHYVRAGGLGLRLPDSDEGTYDVVFSSFALHYLVYFPKLPLDDYQKEGLRLTEWRVEGVQKQHRTIVTCINTYVDEGFEIRGFAEWYPTPQELEIREEFLASGVASAYISTDFSRQEISWRIRTWWYLT